jgi:FkbM family methyltransferase
VPAAVTRTAQPPTRVSEGLFALATELARHTLRCRPGTSDFEVFDQIFVEREYSCLDDLEHVGLIVDCGANVGFSAAYMLSRFPGSRLVAIEPDPGNFEVLRANLAPYGQSATLIQAAVWSHPTGLMLSRAYYRDGRSWARQVRECRPGEDADVTAIDVGSILRQFPGERISLLKMDIEGAEGIVFGANDRSWIDLVDTIAIELHDDSVFGNCSAVFFAAISGSGFSVTRHGELTVCKRR